MRTLIVITKIIFSAKKGESLEDTMRFVSSVVDAIVLRHPGKGDVEKVAQKSSKPVINAGDGIGEHPTQVKSFVQPFVFPITWVFYSCLCNCKKCCHLIQS